ncbi:hypothetical protein K3X13_13980 [Aliiroseovarius crassostreae]|uniref:hypothetical protein n=1 Tax=Aliiroseovarius crassostreae TaxID=154981 RepID=UPI0021FFFC5B|nr:hypothetical protein [Aliiroseovarius crassostreae]UWP92108.1 hypothetical protein K3X13_13980 [Aliiroseovarius crassostreae]
MRELLGQLKEIDLKSIDFQGLKKIDLQGIDKKRLGTAAATLVIALGAGYYMQNGQSQSQAAGPVVQPQPVQTASVLPTPAVEAQAEEQVEAQAEASAPEADPLPQADEVDLAEDLPDPDPAVTPALVQPEPNAVAETLPEVAPQPEESFDLAALDLSPSAEPVVAEPAPLATDHCTPSLTGRVEDLAMMTLTVEAPCNANAEVEFSHEGLRFTEYLDEEGRVEVTVPALTRDAKVSAYLSETSAAHLELVIPEAAQYRRAALVWQGATGLQLHAFEEGADYGDEGHLWADHPGGLTRTMGGEGGFVTVLGSVAQGYAADIYTFPAYMMRSLSGPEMSIEAHILETTCNSEIEGVFLRANGKDLPREMPVRIAAPGCDSVGEYLVFSDMVQELTIALN